MLSILAYNKLSNHAIEMHVDVEEKLETIESPSIRRKVMCLFGKHFTYEHIFALRSCD